jgi:TetR/AcrR family transcriptional regulator, transcriptional repressor for nem operon
MAQQRRVGAETSETRGVLLDGTERLMLDEGYAAVTYRRVAAAAGVTAPLVQYYFPTLDDLFIALLRRRSDTNLQKLTDALTARPDAPLRVIWDYSVDETSAALMIEFMALGNHRKTIRAEIADMSERSRRVQLDALSATRRNRAQPGEEVPDPALLFLMAGIPKVMLMESALGVSTGHAETLDLIKRYLSRTEPEPAQARRKAVKKATKGKGTSASIPRAKKSAALRTPARSKTVRS